MKSHTVFLISSSLMAFKVNWINYKSLSAVVVCFCVFGFCHVQVELCAKHDFHHFHRPFNSFSLVFFSIVIGEPLVRCTLTATSARSGLRQVEMRVEWYIGRIRCGIYGIGAFACSAQTKTIAEALKATFTSWISGFAISHGRCKNRN